MSKKFQLNKKFSGTNEEMKTHKLEEVFMSHSRSHLQNGPWSVSDGSKEGSRHRFPPVDVFGAPHGVGESVAGAGR